MFGKRITLFTLSGFKVQVDMSWLVIALLVTWSLAKGFFPYYYKDLPARLYWVMGAAGALGLFASIVFHEFSHSMVARRYGLPMRGITLFIFGGVAEMTEEPGSAKTEFMMAVAGPVSSVVLGAVFYAAYAVGRNAGWPLPVTAIVNYLAIINWVLAGFNMLPAFPLDGGRVLRSALWNWKGDFRWATRTASRAGAFFGVVLITFGVLNVVMGNVIGGVWYFMIGMFLRGAAQASYQQVLTRKVLEGERVGRFMTRDPVTVPPSLSIEKLVEDYIYKFHFKMFPVVEGDTLVGCVGTEEVRKFPKQQWGGRAVREAADSCSPDNTITPEADAVEALAQMKRTGRSRLMVVEDGRLVGVLSLRDILEFLSLKLALEEEK